jgi:hypothetical protein
MIKSKYHLTQDELNDLKNKSLLYCYKTAADFNGIITHNEGTFYEVMDVSRDAYKNVVWILLISELHYSVSFCTRDMDYKPNIINHFTTVEKRRKLKVENFLVSA